MANKVGYRAAISVGGTAIAEADNIEIDYASELHDVTDLGDYLVQREPGATEVNVRGEAVYGTVALTLISRMQTAMTGVLSVAIAVTNAAGTGIFTAVGYWSRGGLTLPRGAIKQPFELAVNSVTVP